MGNSCLIAKSSKQGSLLLLMYVLGAGRFMAADMSSAEDPKQPSLHLLQYTQCQSWFIISILTDLNNLDKISLCLS